MTFSGSRHFLVVELALLWWPCRSSRNARPQTPPGPEGSNGSGGRVCRDVAVGAASISGHAFDPAGPSASLIPSGTKRWYKDAWISASRGPQDPPFVQYLHTLQAFQRQASQRSLSVQIPSRHLVLSRCCAGKGAASHRQDRDTPFARDSLSARSHGRGGCTTAGEP